MYKLTLIKPNLYSDSVSLMRLSNDVAALEGVEDVLVGMATDLNLELLDNMGAATDESRAATPNDLLIAVIAADEAAGQAALAAIEQSMNKKKPGREEAGEQAFSFIDDVAELEEGFNMAVVSAPGTYAAHECLSALRRGINVFLFSDNVTVEEELQLKEYATKQGLLMMGPDCGTAIINGVALGFANVVRTGDIGIVAASGTGLQQLTQLIDAMGGGITQAIGVGGRDLSAAVGGRTMLAALEALGDDEATRVIVLLSKPPAPEVASKVLEAARNIGKPVVLCLLGRELDVDLGADLGGIELAGNLEETAVAAVRLSMGSTPKLVDPYYSEAELAAHMARLTPEQRYVRGIFCGGTVCDETMVYFRSCGIPIASNIPLSDEERLEDVHTSVGHTFIDMGDDYFTSGKPHPMIDPSLRNKRIINDALLPDTAVMLVDVELGYGSHPDPAGVVAEAVSEANKQLAKEGRTVLWIASVIGTANDPQGFVAQCQKLLDAGMIVSISNIRTAYLAARIVGKAEGLEPFVGTTAPGRPLVSALPEDPRGQDDPRGQVPRVIFDDPRDLSPRVVPEDGRSRATVPTNQIKGSGFSDLFSAEIKAINLGSKDFFYDLESQGIEAVNLEWKPAARGNKQLLEAVDALSTDEVDAANKEAFNRINAAQPFLVGVGTALDTLPGMTYDTILHAGPPITWERMCGPLRGAIIGGLLFEGRAGTAEEAEALAASGSIRFNPCHEHDAVGPMAGVVTPSMPVFILENRQGSNRSYTTMNEGLGKVLRFGAYSQEVLDRLHWMKDVLAPAVKKAIELSGGIDLKAIIAQALHMGDEVHNRNKAATSLFIREILPHLLGADIDATERIEVINFINSNDHFFLNLSMACSKAMLDTAKGVEKSTLLTCMCRNGTDFGIRVAALGGQWFTGPAEEVKGLLFPGFTDADKNPDMGDSSITETLGIGGFAMAASIAIVQFVGGTPADAIRYSEKMYTITEGESSSFSLPVLDFRGTPTGIDVRKVIARDTLPQINTGIAHKEAGIGQVGAGLVTPPFACFASALKALSE